MVGQAQTKATARRTRVIALPKVTAIAFKEWQLASGGRGEQPIVGEMSDNALKRWGNGRDHVHAAALARLDVPLRRLHGPGGGAPSRARARARACSTTRTSSSSFRAGATTTSTR
jgi:hypothetical protein